MIYHLRTAVAQAFIRVKHEPPARQMASSRHAVVNIYLPTVVCERTEGVARAKGSSPIVHLAHDMAGPRMMPPLVASQQLN